MADQQFGKRLAQLRREKAADDHRDIDRRDVAKAVGSSASSLTRWENGEVYPGAETLAALAKYYGVTQSWLRFGEGDKHPGRDKTAEAIATAVEMEDLPGHPARDRAPAKASARKQAGAGRRGR